jgi:hypothetical protein
VVAIRRVNPGVALILCNGQASKAERPELMEGRLIHGSLHKPFPLTRLMELLDDILV